MTGNKVLESSASYAVFVFLGGTGPLVSLRSQGSEAWATPPRWEVGPCWCPQMASGWWDFGWSWFSPCHASCELALARGLGARLSPARHGVSAPAQLCFGPGHRLRGSSPWAGWGSGVMSMGTPSYPATPVISGPLSKFP